jgi:hypothetical protein
VIEADPAVGEPSGLAGSLPKFPDLAWDAFEWGSTFGSERPHPYVRLVADSHATVWYLQGSSAL